MPTDRVIVEHVYKGVQYLFEGLSREFNLDFSGLITRCQELFHTHTLTRSGSYYARIKMPDEQAMQVIQKDLLPLLQAAYEIRPGNASKEYGLELHKLLEYIETEVDIKSPLIGTPEALVDIKSPLIGTPEALTSWQQEVISRLSTLEASVEYLNNASTTSNSWFGRKSPGTHTLMRRMNDLNTDV